MNDELQVNVCVCVLRSSRIDIFTTIVEVLIFRSVGVKTARVELTPVDG